MGRVLALELAVQGVADARVAADAGADRVELCSALRATGGLTPSLALIEQVVDVGLAVHVLIRCRPGPFVYDDAEVAVLVRDAELAVRAGAAGIVFGALTAGNALGGGDRAGRAGVDVGAVARVRDAARSVNPNAEITFHRAFDVLVGAGPASADPIGDAADLIGDDRAGADHMATFLSQLIALGCTRVLTSGGATRSIDGAPVLAELVRQASSRIQIMAGGGVRPGDIAGLAACGVDAVHLSAARPVARPGPPAGPGGGGDLIDVTDLGIARAARRAVDRATLARGRTAALTSVVIRTNHELRRGRLLHQRHGRHHL